MRKLIFVLFFGGLLGYLAGLIVLYNFQRRFMYIPPARYYAPDQVNLPEMQEIQVSWGEREAVTAWWRAPQEGNPIVMFFHGNGGAVYHDAHIFRDLIDQGFGVWATGYPGYPGATGRASQAAMQQATLAQYDLLENNYSNGAPISLYGTSLGSAQAAHLASQRAVDRIVLEAPFYSMKRMVRLKMPIYAFDGLIKDKWQNFEALSELKVPILWLHGTDDRVIPIGEGQRLYDSYDGPKEKIIMQSGTHVNLWVSGGGERIVKFLRNPS